MQHCVVRVKSLPNDKILDMTKLKEFPDNRLNIGKMTISLFDRVENTVGKCWLQVFSPCWLQAFSPLPTVFFKAFFFRIVKSRHRVFKS